MTAPPVSARPTAPAPSSAATEVAAGASGARQRRIPLAPRARRLGADVDPATGARSGGAPAPLVPAREKWMVRGVAGRRCVILVVVLSISFGTAGQEVRPRLHLGVAGLLDRRRRRSIAAARRARSLCAGSTRPAVSPGRRRRRWPTPAARPACRSAECRPRRLGRPAPPVPKMGGMTDAAAFREPVPGVRALSPISTPAPRARCRAGPPTAVRERIDAELAGGRAGKPYMETVKELAAQLRAGYARVLGCADTDVALTGSTTDGVNTVLSGLELRARRRDRHQRRGAPRPARAAWPAPAPCTASR